MQLYLKVVVDDRHLMLTDAEMSVAEEMIVLLKAFHDATEITNGEKYPASETITKEN